MTVKKKQLMICNQKGQLKIENGILKIATHRYGQVHECHGSVVGFEWVPAIEVLLDQYGDVHGDWSNDIQIS